MSVKKSVDRLKTILTLPSVRIGTGIALFLFILMNAIILVERGTNANLVTLFDALWYTMVTITTIGYGDVTPGTVPGKIIAFFIMTCGIVVFGAVSGKIASVLFEQQQKKDKGLITLKKKENHFIICGWQSAMDSILSGILKTNQDLMPSDIVLINAASQEALYPVLSSSQFRGINYVNGDFTEEETLCRANIMQAGRILVLSDFSKDYSSLERDSRTVLAVLVIKKLKRTIYVSAELADGNFRKHLESEHCDEIILSKNFERQLLVSASNGTGLSHVLECMVGTSDTRGLSITDIPERFVGKTFSELSGHFQGESGEILVGLLENTGNFYLRKQEALAEAQKNPDITEVVSNLKKVKEMKNNRTVLAPDPLYAVRKFSKAIIIHRSFEAEGERS